MACTTVSIRPLVSGPWPLVFGLLPPRRLRSILPGMNDEPIVFSRVAGYSAARPEARLDTRPDARDIYAGALGGSTRSWAAGRIRFDRAELNRILNVYGRMVIAGQWRDYAIDFGYDAAVFSAYRRTSEMPLYRIEKRPKLKGRQGQYAVVAPGGHVLKRGHDLAQVLRVLERKWVKAVLAVQN